MKQLFAAAVLIICNFNLIALNDSLITDLQKTSGSITVFSGGSTPVGKFASATGGGAGPGIVGGYNFGQPLHATNFGIAAQLNYSILLQTGKPFLKQQNEISRNTAGLDHYSYRADSLSGYGQFDFLAGMYYTYPFLSRFSADGRALIGINTTVKSQVIVNVEDNYTGQQDYFTQGAGVSTAFCYDLGVSLRVNLGRRHRFALSLNADYLGANGRFNLRNYGWYQENGMTRIGMYDETVNYSVSVINVSAGIGYVFNKRDKKSKKRPERFAN